MSNRSNQIVGQRFSQESLRSDLQQVTAGQSTTFQYLIIIFSLSLMAISGCLAGGSGYMSRSLFLKASSIPAIPWLSSSITLVVLVWLFRTLRCGIAVGLRDTILTAILLSILLVGAFPKEDSFALVILLFTLAAMGVAFLSLLAGSLSFSLIFILFYRRQKLRRKTYAVLVTGISIAVAYLSGGDATDLILSSSTFVPVKLLAGLLSGIVATQASLAVTRFDTQHPKHFLFLRDWTIALCSWGGTSFYNLDLSGVNFTGAELPNTDLRARKLYRTCFQSVTGLDRARVDNRYLDLENRKVQRLLTHGCSEDKDFSGINLQGAYLQNADMQEFQLLESNLTGADLEGAKLQNSILVRARATGVDFTGAKLTGICIEDWSVNSQTIFSGVECSYIYRKYEKGQPTDRYPTGRNFEPGEFEALHQQVSNVVELVFREGVNWRALSFTFRKFEIEDDGLGLELKGVEQRGDLWVVKVAHKEGARRQHVEERVNAIYDELHNLLAVKEQQVNKLLGIAENQAEALKEASKRPFGNSNFFLIVGSDITNLTGSGKINYDEASNTIRSIVANGCELGQITPLAQSLLEQFQTEKVATNVAQQAELIEQVILDQANKDQVFKQFFVQQGQQIADAIPESTIASAIRNAIAQLR